MCRLTVEELRPGRARTLFVFAGAGGDTEELLPVALALTGDVRVVALALRADPAAEETIESMASQSLDVIRAEQPDGPYELLGYSMGGLLALQASRLLIESGETVDRIGMVDSFFDQRSWPTGLFIRASARRTALHARGLLSQPLAPAVRELCHRSGRLSARLLSRHRAANAGRTGFTTAQDANLAVMARWRPSVLDTAVTLFTASESDFGCDLADLWRPWLPKLEVRRVSGNHLDLTQTAEGAERLARAVDSALDAPPPLKVLVASTFRWPGAARLAIELHEIGCTVEGIAPEGSAMHAVSAVQRSYTLSVLAPLRSLEHAIMSSQADIVVPFDDRTRNALTLLHTRADPRTETGARMRERLERSLGSPDMFGLAYSRASLMAVARESGVSCPPTAVVRSARDFSAWFAHHPGPAVLKTDGSWGGRGVAVLRGEADAQRAWRQMRRSSLVRVLKRLVVERDPWPLRERFTGVRPTLSIQSYVGGQAANAAVTCLRGATLGSVQAEVIESDGPTGPSTVVRVIDHPDITCAVTSIVSSFELSGLCGLDFILDDEGRAHLVELNPRATPTAHLVGANGRDPLTALRAALGYERPPARAASYPDGLVALFPQELHRDSASPLLRHAHHDVPPHAPDFVASVLDAGRGGRRWVPPRSPVRARQADPA